MKAIEEIYRLYKDDVYKYLISITRDPNLSEDLLSETFIRAIKSIARFRGESSIKTWLLSIARYTWYDQVRRDKKEIPLHDLISLYISEDIEKTAINREVADRIMELLNKEDERNRDIVLMRINGYSYFEIGRKHGISESSARVINHRIKTRIGNLLKEEGLRDE